MKGNGPRFERETIINFNEEEATASIWTASETVYRRLLKRLGRAYLTEDGERHAVFVFPRNFLGLPRVKVKKPLDPTRRVKLASQIADRRKLLEPESKNGPS
jgi:hypothetical protein